MIVAMVRGNAFVKSLLSHIDVADSERAIINVPVVIEYPDVFEEVPNLLPVREIEFYIELLPGITPIHWSPYRMSLFEKEELRRKLDDLLARDFIRRSWSHGALPFSS